MGEMEPDDDAPLSPAHNWLSMDEAINHCTRGIGIWEWAPTDAGTEPGLVMACAGDVPTLETPPVTAILREAFPELKVRVVNVVDLMRLEPDSEHPHGLPDREFDALFTSDKPVVFAYHGYPWLIHRLTYRRTNHHNIHVRLGLALRVGAGATGRRDVGRNRIKGEQPNPSAALRSRFCRERRWFRNELTPIPGWQPDEAENGVGTSKQPFGWPDAPPPRTGSRSRSRLRTSPLTGRCRRRRG